MTLFQAGDFTLRSGQKSTYRFECDALTPADWAGIAAVVMEEKLLPPFRVVFGVPRGGVPFAAAMNAHCTMNLFDPILICEDVVTTGGSVERFRGQMRAGPMGDNPEGGYIGVVLFARGPCPDWVVPVFQQTRAKA